MQTLSEIETALRAREAELLAKVSNIDALLDQPGDPDIEEQASNRQADEPLEGVEAIALAEIRAIRRTFARIASGAYGRCRKCGGKISSERLTLLPHADECVRCV